MYTITVTLLNKGKTIKPAQSVLNNVFDKKRELTAPRSMKKLWRSMNTRLVSLELVCL